MVCWENYIKVPGADPGILEGGMVPENCRSVAKKRWYHSWYGSFGTGHFGAQGVGVYLSAPPEHTAIGLYSAWWLRCGGGDVN